MYSYYVVTAGGRVCLIPKPALIDNWATNEEAGTQRGYGLARGHPVSFSWRRWLCSSHGPLLGPPRALSAEQVVFEEFCAAPHWAREDCSLHYCPQFSFTFFLSFFLSKWAHYFGGWGVINSMAPSLVRASGPRSGSADSPGRSFFKRLIHLTGVRSLEIMPSHL